MIYYSPFGDVKLFSGIFLSRPNRFVVRCSLGGTEVTCHLPNPGRLWEILLPGAELLLTKNSSGRTDYTAVGLRSPGRNLLLHTQKTNDLAEALIKSKSIPFLRDYSLMRREVKALDSRFDFLLLDEKGDELYLEVKSCTLLGCGGAMFPDAPSERALRHVKELSQMAEKNIRCAILFVVNSKEAKWFMPEFHTDPSFSRALIESRGKIGIKALGVTWEKDLTVREPPAEIPIDWDGLEKSFKNSGGLMALFRLDENLEFDGVSLEPGYWICAFGSKDLDKDMKSAAAKKSGPKSLFQKIRSKTSVKLIPIRSFKDMGREIKDTIRPLSVKEVLIPDSPENGWGRSFFYLDLDPFEMPEFAEALLNLRMNRALLPL